MFLDPITIAKFVANPENRAKLAQTWPAKAGKAIWDGVTLPGDVWHGNVDPLSDDAIKRATDLAGVNMLGTNFSAPVGALGAGPTRLANPIRAYHGSPHDFDKFDMTKIGTGEGAQVYGHGLYFAENPAVARSYQEGLSLRAGQTKAPLIDGIEAPQFANRAAIQGKENQYEAANQYWNFIKNSAPGSNNSYQGLNFGRVTNEQAFDAFLQNLKSQAQQAGPNYADYYKNILQGAEEIRPLLSQQPTAGKLYDVNLHVKPEQLLDYDLPISKQSENIQKFARDIKSIKDFNNLGQDVISFNNYEKYNPIERTEQLLSYGIPGLQYFDQGSRKLNEGTRNFVMFDPDLIEIVGKRATGGAVTDDDSIQTAAHIANKLATGGKVTGYLHTDGNGRTDNLPMKVPNGAYVIPADIVSGLGQGNSLAGRKTLEEIFQRPQFATGGSVQDNDEGIDIIAAGGEYVIDPETVAAIADGDLDLGHEILDRFVVDTRKRIIKEMKSLPGPAQD